MIKKNTDKKKKEKKNQGNATKLKIKNLKNLTKNKNCKKKKCLLQMVEKGKIATKKKQTACKALYKKISKML